jgi:hypothetical protein
MLFGYRLAGLRRLSQVWSGRALTYHGCMEITRRSLLGMLAAGFVVDPERLLWVPGRKLISIPEPPIIPAGHLYCDACQLIRAAVRRAPFYTASISIFVR